MSAIQEAEERAKELKAIETPEPDARPLLILTITLGCAFAYGMYGAFPEILETVKGWVL